MGGGGGVGEGVGGEGKNGAAFIHILAGKCHCGADKAGAAMGRLCAVRRPFKKKGGGERRKVRVKKEEREGEEMRMGGGGEDPTLVAFLLSCFRVLRCLPSCALPAPLSQRHSITESLRLEKTTKSTESDHQPTPTAPSSCFLPLPRWGHPGMRTAHT